MSDKWDHQMSVECSLLYTTLAVSSGGTLLAWSSPRWAGKHRFYVTCVLGPLLRPHNVRNNRTLGSIARHVQDKQNIAGYDRHWPPASLQSAQSAAGAQYTVRGGQLSRPSARPQRAPAMPHAYHTFGFDVDQRLTACCHLIPGVLGPSTAHGSLAL